MAPVTLLQSRATVPSLFILAVKLCAKGTVIAAEHEADFPPDIEQVHLAEPPIDGNSIGPIAVPIEQKVFDP